MMDGRDRQLSASDIAGRADDRARDEGRGGGTTVMPHGEGALLGEGEGTTSTQADAVDTSGEGFGPPEGITGQRGAGTAAPREDRMPREGRMDGGGATEITGRRTDTDQVLLGDEETGRLRRRWEEIQAGFVDEPRRAVERADTLVAEVMEDLASTFARMRGDLERQWSGGSEGGTEELRVALQRYRTFFETLLHR